MKSLDNFPISFPRVFDLIIYFVLAALILLNLQVILNNLMMNKRCWFG